MTDPEAFVAATTSKTEMAGFVPKTYSIIIVFSLFFYDS